MDDFETEFDEEEFEEAPYQLTVSDLLDNFDDYYNEYMRAEDDELNEEQLELKEKLWELYERFHEIV